jgi:hypothetical protein
VGEDDDVVNASSLDEMLEVASSSRDAGEDSAIAEEFEVDAGTVGVTLEAVDVTEVLTTMDGAFTVEVTLSVLLVRGMLLGAAISGAEVTVSVPVALTVMVGKMGDHAGCSSRNRWR